MDAATRLKLEELRKEAFKRLRASKRKATSEEQRLIKLTLNMAIHLVYEQAVRDLRTYPLYDCFAMWLDPDAGLAHYEPEVILAIAKEILNG